WWRAGGANFHLRQLSRRHWFQRAAVSAARGTAGPNADADRRLRLRERVPRLCRAGRQHRSARQGRRPENPRFDDPDRRVVNELADRIRTIVKAPPRAAAGVPFAPPPPGQSNAAAVLRGEWTGGCFVVD